MGLPVKTQKEQIMAGDTLGGASFGNHLKLWHNGNCLQVNWKSPQKFLRAEIVMDEEGETDGGDQDEFNSESR